MGVVRPLRPPGYGPSSAGKQCVSLYGNTTATHDGIACSCVSCLVIQVTSGSRGRGDSPVRGRDRTRKDGNRASARAGKVQEKPSLGKGRGGDDGKVPPSRQSGRVQPPTQG